MRKLLSVLLITAMLSAIPAAAETAPPPINYEAYVSTYEQGGVMEALQVFQDSFPLIDGIRAYPNDYAGFWLSAAAPDLPSPKLHIALTSGMPEVIARYNEIFAGYEDIIAYVTEGFYYSYNELLILYDRVFDILSESDFPFIGGHILVGENKVYFEFLETDTEAVKAFLSEAAADIIPDKELNLGVFFLRAGDGVHIEYEPMPEPDIPSSNNYDENENPQAGVIPGFGAVLIAGGISIITKISRKKK
ncbi:MAG: hypothetical protein LBC86_08120 [Oscillospiraceae bacterium]|jgi:hypothetical protein|nr:hypothetical protein [Oscillospiraceae bacterium]